MRKLIFIFVLLYAYGALGQTSCTATAPCVQVQITNPNTLPSSTVLWTCMGGASNCSQSALASVIAQQTLTNLCPTVPSVWHCNQFSQTKTPQLYNDPEPWGALMNYSSQGTTGGGASATSPIVIFQVPQQAAQQTSIGSVPAIVTTGVAGPQ